MKEDNYNKNVYFILYLLMKKKSMKIKIWLQMCLSMKMILKIK